MGKAAQIAAALDGRPCGNGFICRCLVPGHGKGRGDLHRSLSVADGDGTEIVVHCFANCDSTTVLDELRRRGLLDDRPPQPRLILPPPPPPPHEPDVAAVSVWARASCGAGSIVEKYLRARAITLPIPPTLRCGSVMHLGRFEMPAMIAAVQRPDGRVVTIQTTALTWSASKAPVYRPRNTVGAVGAGAVRLAKAEEVLGVAEGVETALSAMQLSLVPCWACLGAARMHNVAVPDRVRELHVFADNDTPGRDAAERVAAAHRHRRVVLRFPPDGFGDWNDFLMGKKADAA